MPSSLDQQAAAAAARRPMIDLALMGAVLAVAGGLWLFLQLTDAVLEGETQAIDEAILRSLRRPGNLAVAIGPRWLPEVVRDLTALGGAAITTLTALAVGGFLLIARKYHAVFLLAVAIGGGSFLAPLLKGWIGRPRPTGVPHLMVVSSASFPSGHSLSSTVVYLTLGMLLARMAPTLGLRVYVLAVALLVALLVGLSRIYLGVHYPSDVLGGWMVGLAWAVTCGLAARWLQRLGMVESSSDPRES